MTIYTYLSKTFSAVTLITLLSGLLISPGAPGCKIGTADMLSVEISRPLKREMSVTAEKPLER